MDFNKIKQGFGDYLTKIYKDNLGNNTDKEQAQDTSIFNHQDEFRNYLKDELSIDSVDANIDIEDIKNFEVINGELVNLEEIKNQSEEEIFEEDLIQNVMNELMKNEEFMAILDRDEDGELSNEELLDFYESISHYDENNETISVNDILQATKDINDGKFKFVDETTAKEEAEALKKASQENFQEQLNNYQQIAENAQAMNSGTNQVLQSSSAQGNNNVLNTEKALENMSIPELETEKSTKENELQDAQDEINKVHSGENKAVKQAQLECDEAKIAYDEAVKNDEKISEELKEKKDLNLEAIANKESEINNKEIEINNKKSEISQKESSIASIETNISALESSLSSLQSQSSDDPDRQAAIQAQIASVQSQIDAQKTELKKEKEALTALNTELETLEDELLTLEDGLTSLNEEKAEIEEAILANCGEETKLALEAYNTAKENVENVKAEQLEIAQANVNTKLEELNKIESLLNVKKATETQRKYNLSDPLSQYNEEYGQSLANTASSLYPNSGFGGYCATGVSNALQAATGREKTYGNGCDYANVMQNRDDFVEYSDFDFNSMSATEVQNFLLSLPTGAVVSFGATAENQYGHVMIMDGKGNEISDGTNSVGTYYRNWYSSMSVFIPVG